MALPQSGIELGDYVFKPSCADLMARLVATLGSRSTPKKVGRKDILQVDISKACRTIDRPAAPMALRLQSNLLFGVSRVFYEQCNYVLGDVQAAAIGIRQMLRTVNAAQLEMCAPKTGRTENLLLADDPAFDPTQSVGDIDLDFLHRGLISDVESRRHISSPQTPVSSGDVPAIIIPSSASGAGAIFEPFLSSGETAPKFGRLSDLTQMSIPNLGLNSDDALLPEADFAIDADGNLIEADFATISHGRTGATSGEYESEEVNTMAENGTLRAQIGAEEGAFRMDVDEFPALPTDDDVDGVARGSTVEDGSGILSSLPPVASTQSSEYANAPMIRKKRQGRPIGLDRGALELRTSEIAAWSTDYLANMQTGVEMRRKAQDGVLGKRNANFWIWEAGIGGVGLTSHLRSFGRCSDPFDMFYGDRLRDWVCGLRSGMTKKRQLGDETNVLNERRVRPRKPPIETGRGVPFNHSDDQEAGRYGDEEDIEHGRDAPTPLQGGQDFDISSSMPWNMSGGPGSRSQSSVRNFYQASGRTSATPLAQGRAHHQHSLRPGSRTPSASPMPGLAGIARLLVDNDDQPGNSLGSLGDIEQDEEMERFGQAAFVDIQTAEQSQYVRRTLDNESGNFIEFVEQAIGARADAGTCDEGNITFATLLPPAENTHIVAAQALLHSLTLATIGLLNLKQESHFGDIWLTLVL